MVAGVLCAVVAAAVAVGAWREIRRERSFAFFGRARRRWPRPVTLVTLGAGALGAVAFLVLVVVHLRDPHPHTPTELVAEITVLVFGTLLLLVLGRGTVLSMHHEPARRVLVVGAHPDDLELACGGTVATLARSGHRVKVVVMSGGSVGGDESVRRGEAVAGASLLGTDDVTVHAFPDTRLAEADTAMIAAVEQAMHDFRPDLILTHSEHDQHQDHQAVHRAVLRAGRQAPSILCFESPSVTRSFNPSVFVDITEHLDLKVRAVQAHRNQAGKPYMTASRVRGIAAFRGAQAKVVAAEAFEPVRYLQEVR